ncbi:TrkA family potassium uptake protein [Citromicrobium bathyomarinum]|nr:TrkA family potassium uptake protein [Citromicrobium sp. JL477]KPM12747.1 potassium transporter [Citromicrobium sp. JL31]KPM15963.1 potassium transporter [Citromicrobium sp. WPS32]KPM19133.1 potassium transporter [Citromicrobium sp. JL1351]KPM22664.1 potassium transporter [Citromicrobium sp. RCC1885]KPM26147.1 potassium transporter [Citromicrobium sp. RCC1878]KPM29516.1 potassium transporter [Citromicrobium sp. JL2201]MAO05208.1 TrkA family potassium uptake protein [Citromicrobium sp.]OA|tara:strand:- start:4066 stop:4698 length:633 start_codon:yes stop_codon:yes gene_type:complete
MVIGLGRFGGAVSRTLERMGHEVLAVDTDPALVQHFAGDLTKVVEADATETTTLERLGAKDFDAAVVAIGTDIEASVLTVLALADLGLTNIWAKATNEKHARILERTGATHVVFPEQRMGERVAHLINERLLDFISFGDEFAIARLVAPEPLLGLPLVTSQCRKKYDVTVVGVKREGEDFIHAVPDTLIFPGDELVVSGRIHDLEAFSAM